MKRNRAGMWRFSRNKPIWECSIDERDSRAFKLEMLSMQQDRSTNKGMRRSRKYMLLAQRYRISIIRQLELTCYGRFREDYDYKFMCRRTP